MTNYGKARRWHRRGGSQLKGVTKARGDKAEPPDLRYSLNAGHCPDCGCRGFYFGPGGVINEDLECMSCRHVFNVTWTSPRGTGGIIILAERVRQQ
jgi:hypothetical protein